jgi:hypothetical protein
MDPFEIMAAISSLYPAISSLASLAALRREGSNNKMSSQKARTILHWFSACYGGNSPIFLSLFQNKKDLLQGLDRLWIPLR